MAAKTTKIHIYIYRYKTSATKGYDLYTDTAYTNALPTLPLNW